MEGPRAHILVVDDDPDFVCAHQLALERAGFSVEAAAGGIEALERLLKGEINLVVLDVMLDHPTEGFEVCHAMRHHPGMRDIPILLVSSVEREGHALFDPVADRSCLMCDDFARKPVRPAELVRRVEALLAKRSKTDRGGAGTVV